MSLNILNNLKNLRRIIPTVAMTSVIIGINMVFTVYSHAVMTEPDIKGLEDHPHPHINSIQMNSAEELVASKEKSDMTYKQMMQRMGEAYNLMHRGILHQNKELVRLGVWMIDNHPAPKEKPWGIMKQQEQKAFKETLISYNKLLHTGAANINEALKKGDWHEINKGVFGMSNSCISCHQVWKDKTIK